MKISDGVHYLQHPLGAIWTGITLVEDELLLIVDTGTQAAPHQTVLPYLVENNIWSGQPALVVNTHCHCDHIGGNTGLQSTLGAELVAHQADAAWIEDRVQQYQGLFGPFRTYPKLAMSPVGFYQMAGQDSKLARVLFDGDCIRTGQREFKVLHLPGHTAGSLALYEADTGLLLTGDSVQGRGTIETQVPMIADMTAYRRSLQRLADLDISMLVAAHPFLPFPTALFDAQSAHSFIQDSLAVVDEYTGIAASLLEASGKPASLLIVSEGLAASLHLPLNNLYNVILTAACLDELAGSGQAQRLSGVGWQPEGEFTSR
jgi:glyoxylase-like metal-dependent hydrolase (beta-lactamase superfamily II)